jgi:hypothetical protein
MSTAADHPEENNMIRMCTVFALAAIVTLEAIAVSAAPVSESTIRELLDGVSEIGVAGVPGPLCVFGRDARSVVVGATGSDARLPVVAVADYGKGRVAVFGHDGYMGDQVLNQGDTGRLVTQIVQWLAGDSDQTLKIGVIGKTGLPECLQQAGLSVIQTDLKSFETFDAVYVRSHLVTREADRRRLQTYVAEGGGLLTSGLGWGWKQLNPGKQLATDHPGNRLLAPMGITFADGTLKKTGRVGFVTPAAPNAWVDAWAALEAIRNEERAKAVPKEGLAQVSLTLTSALDSLPDEGVPFVSDLRTAISQQAANRVPSPETPVRADDVFGRLSVTLQTRAAQRMTPDQARPHPAADVFPGPVPADAPRIERQLTIDTSVPDWHSTGLYAPPGEPIRIRIPETASSGRLSIRIGGHKDRIWHHQAWKRMPEVTRTWQLSETDTQVVNAFGGLVYIDVPRACKLGEVAVTVDGAVQAPLYVLGQTSMDEWQILRQAPGPWAELATDRIIITVPSTSVRTLDDPKTLMETWNRVLDACAELACRPFQRTRPERIVPDLQISAGYMHAGYPIMTWSDQYTKLVDTQVLLDGSWGLFHELGHNHQSPDWTFRGTTEVTVNLFTLYVFEKVSGVPVAESRITQKRVQDRVRDYLLGGASFDKWKSDPFVALVMYAQLQQAFGWETYQKVFTEYRNLDQQDRPRTDDEKRDQWLVRFSRAAGRNLGPFFQAWGVPTSEKARASVANLPDWMPNDMPATNGGGS